MSPNVAHYCCLYHTWYSVITWNTTININTVQCAITRPRCYAVQCNAMLRYAMLYYAMAYFGSTTLTLTLYLVRVKLTGS